MSIQPCFFLWLLLYGFVVYTGDSVGSPGSISTQVLAAEANQMPRQGDKPRMVRMCVIAPAHLQG